MMVTHPDNKPMWVALGICVLTATPVAITGGRNEFLNSLASLSLLALVMTAKVVEMYHDPLLQQEVTKEYVLDHALTQPWWSTKAA